MVRSSEVETGGQREGGGVRGRAVEDMEHKEMELGYKLVSWEPLGEKRTGGLWGGGWEGEVRVGRNLENEGSSSTVAPLTRAAPLASISPSGSLLSFDQHGKLCQQVSERAMHV